MARLLALPGRVCVEPRRLGVILAPAPFHPALHLCGLDDPVADVGWLGGRTVTFELEGL